MIRRLPAVLILLFTTSLAFTSGVRAHDGHEHKVMGTITMAAVDHVMLKTTDGKDVTIEVTKDTKVISDKGTLKVQDIAVNTRVVVTTISDKDRLQAKEIQVGVAVKPAAK